MQYKAIVLEAESLFFTVPESVNCTICNVWHYTLWYVVWDVEFTMERFRHSMARTNLNKSEKC